MIDSSWVYIQIVEKYADHEGQIGNTLYRMFELLYSLPAVEQEVAVDEFESLLHGLELLPDRTYRPRIWRPATEFPHLTKVARVRPDLMSHDGWQLNGRVGEIIAKRRGDVIIVFDRPVPGAPPQYRGVISEFEVDISHLDTPAKGHQ